MRIKDFLNEFEADRAALPGVEKETLARYVHLKSRINDIYLLD